MQSSKRARELGVRSLELYTPSGRVLPPVVCRSCNRASPWNTLSPQLTRLSRTVSVPTRHVPDIFVAPAIMRQTFFSCLAFASAGSRRLIRLGQAAGTRPPATHVREEFMVYVGRYSRIWISCAVAGSRVRDISLQRVDGVFNYTHIQFRGKSTRPTHRALIGGRECRAAGS